MNDFLRLGDGYEWKSDAHRLRFQLAISVALLCVAGSVICLILGSLPPATFGAITQTLTRGAPVLALIIVGGLIVRYRRSVPLRLPGSQTKYKTYRRTLP